MLLCRCLLDAAPRTFTTEEAAVLCNFAELVICTLEDLARAKSAKWTQAGHAVIQVAEDRIKMVAANQAFLNLAGVAF